MSSDDFEGRLHALEQRVSRLEYREGWIRKLLPSESFASFVLENDLDAEQIAGIESVMEAAQQALSKGGPLDALDFERRLVPFIPPKEMSGNVAQDFVQRLLNTYAMTGQWYEVVDHFRRHFNVPSQEKLTTR